MTLKQVISNERGILGANCEQGKLGAPIKKKSPRKDETLKGKSSIGDGQIVAKMGEKATRNAVDVRHSRQA